MATLEACNEAILELKDKIRDKKTALVDHQEKLLSSVGKEKGLHTPQTAIKMRRRLEGHFGKIYAFHWGPDSQNLVSASQDGNMFVWNAVFGLKIQGITLKSSWVMACGYSPNGHLVATAGLDNVVWIYKVEEGATEDVYLELAGHEGYISSCLFLNDRQMVTTSGDCSAALWDIEARKMTQEFTEHTLDVNCCALADQGNLFLTGSCDSTTKLWDVRVGNRSVRTFIGHESDVNSVAFFPDGNSFLSGSDDTTCRLYDIRSYSMINTYGGDEQHFFGVTSAAVSKSGKYVLTSYDTGPVIVWDTVYATEVQSLEGHEKRVSRVRVSPDGSAIATSSWDTNLIVWA
jgi:guanine nucleotide-binding protein G(I)/G(S)/G(T) subunit beta-1